MDGYSSHTNALMTVNERLNDFGSLSALLSGDEKRALAEEQAHTKAQRKMGDGESVRVRLDKSGRRGKTVTIIEGFSRQMHAVEELAQQLRKECGTGGTVIDHAIELQGDQVRKASTKLKALGFTIVK